MYKICIPLSPLYTIYQYEEVKDQSYLTAVTRRLTKWLKNWYFILQFAGSRKLNLFPCDEINVCEEN